jgi:hypothetical protein
MLNVHFSKLRALLTNFLTVLLTHVDLGLVLVIVDVCVEHFFTFFVFLIGSSMAIAESKNINQMGISGVVGE